MLKLLLMVSLSQVQIVNETGRNLGRVPTIECGKTMTCGIVHNTWATLNMACSGVLGCTPVCSPGQFLSNDGGTFYCGSPAAVTIPVDGYTGLLTVANCPLQKSNPDGGIILPCQKGVPFISASSFSGPSNNPDGGFYDFSVSITCGQQVVGSGGTTGIVMRIDDKTASTTLCTCTIGACNTSALLSETCACAGGLTPGHTYALVMDNTSDCTNYPGAMVCSANFAVLSH